MSVIGWSLMRFGEDLHFFPVELIRIKLEEPVCQRCVCRWANSSGAGKGLEGQQERKRRLGAEGGTEFMELFFSFSVLIKCRLDTHCLNKYLLSK